MLRKCAMQRLTLCLCGVALVCPAFAERALPPALPETLTVAIFPQGHYAPLVLREMAREVGSILRHSGVKVEWRLGAGQQVFDEPLAIVKLIGTCNMDLSATRGNPGPLGWTHAVNGEILPFSEVACDNVRRAIQSEMRAEDWSRGNALLGRAMGRVLAHELFHIVAATKEHTGSGVSQSALSPAELISDRLDLDPAGVELIQDRLHGTR
jgi:hypothetical protein